jgi:hypothetical protein
VLFDTHKYWLINEYSGCAWSPGEVEQNIRSDIQALKASSNIQKDISIIGYVLDLTTGQLREVKYVQILSHPPFQTKIFQNPVNPLLWHSTESRISDLETVGRISGVGECE